MSSVMEKRSCLQWGRGLGTLERPSRCGCRSKSQGTGAIWRHSIDFPKPQCLDNARE
jgi:hypothetical protein